MGVSPFNIGLAVRTNAQSSNWQIDITMDDPFGTFPSSAGPTVFQSSQVGGSGSSVSGVALSAGSSNSIGSITTPIAALRLTNTSTSGTATLTVLQSGRA